MRFALVVLLALLAAFPTHAGKSSHGRTFPGARGGYSTSVCPFGTSYADGCVGANQKSSFIVSTTYGTSFPTYATSGTFIGAGQSWVAPHRQPWNVAGVDYSVGYDTSLTLKDPSLQQPIGCSYSATGGLGSGPRMFCTGASPDIEGYDFSLHNGISLTIQGSVTGNVIIKNNKFACGSAICTATGALVADNGAESTIYIGFNLFDGGDEFNSTLCAGGRCTVDGISAITLASSTSARTLEYNVFLYTTGRPIDGRKVGSVTSIRRFNYAEGIQGQDGNSQHAEFIEETNPSVTVVPEEDDLYNTIVMAKYFPTLQATAPFYISSGSSTSTNNGGLGVTFTLWNVIGNTIIGNYDGTRLATNGGALVQTFNGSITGTTLTVNSGASGVPVGAGLSLLCGGIYSRVVSGTFPTYTLSCAPGNVTSVSISSSVYTSSAAIRASYNTFGTIVARSNYIDPTGNLNGNCFYSDVGGNITTADFGSGGTPNSGGTQNVNLLTGSVAVASWTTNPGC